MTGRDEAGRFMPGNRFWEARSTAGPKPKFEGPEPLWAACLEYFAWVEDNPLLETKGFAFQGVVTKETFPKMRAMTIGGLCLFLDIDVTTWRDWKENRSDLSPVITRAEAVIYQQKFTGAAAEMLNANIIARDLGLADKTELTGKDGGPIQTEDVKPAEKLRAKLDAITSRATSSPAEE
ncbi:MAG: DNA-packaging protein [Paracoccaceae bacterium]